jgi:hypothetical protein
MSVTETTGGQRLAGALRLHQFDVGWAATARELRGVQWQLGASDDVRGVFMTARDDVLAVLYSGDRAGFEALARALAPDGRKTVR